MYIKTSLFALLLFQTLAQNPTPMSTSDFMRSLGRDLEEPGTPVFSNIVHVLTQVVSISDLIPLFSRTSLAPLNRARAPLRRYFIENVLNGNDRPSEDDLRQAVSRVVNEDMEHFQTLVAVPWFLIFIGLEIAYSTYKGNKHYYRANDALTSIGAGLLQQSAKVLFHGVEFSLSCYIYEHYCIVRLPWDSPWTWIIAFFAVDFTYYWFHRAVHEINFLWSFHQMHHSSQYYNLSTALRQGMFQQYSSMFFSLPEAFIVPPSAHMVHLGLNTIYQFWIHTQLIKNLGPLEYFINTPSHHRVHHGRNPYCIDKNYAGTLIIWDRLFGTFQAEKPEEPVAYGLVHNVNTFDQIYCQLFHFKYVFFDKLRSMQTFGDKLKAIFYGPGWFPGTPRMGNLSDIPAVESPIQVHDPRLSWWIALYGFMQFNVTNFIYMTFAGQRETLSYLDALPYILFITLSLQSMSAFFDKKFYAPYLEFARCATLYYWFFPKIWPPYSFLHASLHTILGGSTAFWMVKVLPITESDKISKKLD